MDDLTGTTRRETEHDIAFRKRALQQTLITLGLATLPLVLAIGALCWNAWLGLLVVGVAGVAWARADALKREWDEAMPPWGLPAIRGMAVMSALVGIAVMALPFVLLALG